MTPRGSAAGPQAAALPSVSILIPAREAEEVLEEALDSVMAQDYPGPMEVVLVDGSDTGAASDLVRRRFPSVQIVRNPERIVPTGLNAALRIANGEVIVRCDAHTVLPPDYVRRAVKTLMRTGAANVGGMQTPVGRAPIERAIAMAMASQLGSGGARYRTGGVEGPADTVYLGVFRREVLDEVGHYDPSLVRNQDYELNWQLRQRGYTVWFDPTLSVVYRPRSSFRALARQYFDYGRWKNVVLRRYPASLRPRQVAAPLLVAGLALSAALGAAGLAAGAVLPVAYLLAIGAESVAVAARGRLSEALLFPIALATMHLTWGFGFFFPPMSSARAARAWNFATVPGDGAPSVSVIIAARNAELTIETALDSVFAQDYPGIVEVIVADGSDTPALGALVQRSYPAARLVPNPDGSIPAGLNAALREATGHMIVRCDAHSVLPPGYVRRAVATQARTGAGNVGGRQWPVGHTLFERAVGLAMTDPLGAGGARYRIGGSEGSVDTVYLGTFPRCVLESVGGYNPDLARNEDYELNWRLRMHRYRVWYDPELVADYQPRSALRTLARQYFDNGRWKRAMLRRYPGSVQLRQLAAPAIVVSLASTTALAAAGSAAAAMFPLAYGLAVVAGAAVIGVRRRSRAALLLPLVLPTIHLAWGAGFFYPPSRPARGGGGDYEPRLSEPSPPPAAAPAR